MLAPLLTCTMCRCASLQAQYAAGFKRLWLDGRDDVLQASHFKHNSALAAVQTLLSPRQSPTIEPLQPFIHSRFMYSQTVHTRHRRHPTGVAQGTSPPPHRGFRAVILAFYTKCALSSSAFLTKKSFLSKQMNPGNRRRSVLESYKSCCWGKYLCDRL